MKRMLIGLVVIVVALVTTSLCARADDDMADIMDATLNADMRVERRMHDMNEGNTGADLTDAQDTVDTKSFCISAYVLYKEGKLPIDAACSDLCKDTVEDILGDYVLVMLFEKKCLLNHLIESGRWQK